METNSTPLPFAEKLRLRRYELRMSQSDLAKQAGITRNYVGIIENGAPCNVSWTVLQKICAALQMDFVIDAYPAGQKKVAAVYSDRVKESEPQ